MEKKEFINSVKKILIENYGENLVSTESGDKVEWKFDGGLTMCSVMFVGEKYEVKINQGIICGTLGDYSEDVFRSKVTSMAMAGSLKFLESFLAPGPRPGKLWKEHHGVKFRLELDATTGKLGWAMSCEGGKKFIYSDGVCKEI